MKRIIPAVAVVALAILNVVPAQAGGSGRWCAVYGMGRGNAYWDCQYATLEQCVPNVVAGNRGFCNTNPAYVEPHPPLRHRRTGRGH